MCTVVQKWSIVVFMATVQWLPFWCGADGQSLVILKYNVAWYYMSKDNFLCLTPEDDDLAGLIIHVGMELANILHNEWEA